MQVWKYPVPIKALGDNITLHMPVNAKPLCVKKQSREPVMWALCDPKAHTEIRLFRWVMTGEEVKDGVLNGYIGTLQFENGNFILHLFEVVK